MSTQAHDLARTLVARSSPPPLSPTAAYHASLTPAIDALPDSPPIRAALHLVNDDTHRAHEVAQADEGNSTSDYVHQQLHRREGDFWNSKWWAGNGMRAPHPVMKKVHGGFVGAKRFVDDCERASGQSANDQNLSRIAGLEQTQWQELQATLEYALENEAA
ncbi:hypothetical protein HDZ31DRAFT_63632 [Schizophyllum fasciatum]